jgi:hypothetical protein
VLKRIENYKEGMNKNQQISRLRYNVSRQVLAADHSSMAYYVHVLTYTKQRSYYKLDIRPYLRWHYTKSDYVLSLNKSNDFNYFVVQL